MWDDVLYRSELTDVYFIQITALSGLIPSEIGLLSELQYLEIIGTSLIGPLPTELGNLQELREL
jgi:hypothetical protein